MSVGPVGGTVPAPLQSSWTRAERACAARHRGDEYYDLLADNGHTVAPAVAASAESGSASTIGLQPGFTLHL